MTMRASVKGALDARPGPIDERDRAAADLAVHYATLIDAAAPAGRYATALRWLANADCESDADLRAKETIRMALARHSVASDLGPKLLAALTELGLTPRARAAATEGVKPSGQPTSALDQLAERRRSRTGRTPNLDPAAP
jgi:hypothetical protein